MPDTEITLGSVRQQVVGLERAHDQLRTDLHGVERKVDQGFQAITTKLDEKTTPQWQAIGIVVAVLSTLGGALIYPMRETSSRQEAQIEALRTVTVPRVELERQWKDQADDQHRNDDRMQRVWESVNKTARDLGYLEGQLHPLQK